MFNRGLSVFFFISICYCFVLTLSSVCVLRRLSRAIAKVKRILYYTAQDLGLGQFLLESCFNTTLKFHGERRSVLDVTQVSYSGWMAALR